MVCFDILPINPVICTRCMLRRDIHRQPPVTRVVAAGKGGGAHVASMDVDSDGRAFCQGWTDRSRSGEIRGSPRRQSPRADILGLLCMLSFTCLSSPTA